MTTETDKNNFTWNACYNYCTITFDFPSGFERTHRKCLTSCIKNNSTSESDIADFELWKFKCVPGNRSHYEVYRWCGINETIGPEFK